MDTDDDVLNADSGASDDDDHEHDHSMDEDEPERHFDESAFLRQYHILRPKDIITDQLTAIESIHELFQVCVCGLPACLKTPRSTARQLLQHFGWDKDKLVDKFYSREDQDWIYEEAHTVNPNKAVKPIDLKGVFECLICAEDVPAKEVYGMGCRHAFCKSCWNAYLEEKIKVQGMAQNIACPQEGCAILVDEVTVSELLEDPAALSRYEYLVAKAFVQGNKHIKWCPSPGCENAVKVDLAVAKPVLCECGTLYCFNCTKSWHDPVKCNMLAKWTKKCEDDSETANWIAANTKECTKCHQTIEKNGGCNHMTCRNEACKYEFCWTCMGPWEPHGSSWYTCNRFDEADSKDARETAAQSRQSLERYLFYFNRFANHKNSLKLEAILFEKVKKTMVEMQKHSLSWIEAQFLEKAFDTLSRCRTTLMYTYVFAYYLMKNNQTVIFEDNQANLEVTTENLSELLERDITTDISSEEIVKLKQQVQDKSQYCENRRKKLLEHVNQGHDCGFWEYSQPIPEDR